MHKTTREDNFEAEENTIGINECDTDADTCCLGKNFLIYSHTNRSAEVYSYDKTIPPKIIPIVTGATCYDNRQTGETVILLFHESLFYGTRLDHTLINPNQIRHYGIPTWDNPFDYDRSLGIEVDNDLFIPFDTKGTKIYFQTRTPTMHELQNCRKVDMTSPNLWDPEHVVLKKIERREQKPSRVIQAVRTNVIGNDWVYSDPSSDEAILHSINPALTQHVREIDSYDPKYEDIMLPRSYISTDRHQQTRHSREII